MATTRTSGSSIRMLEALHSMVNNGVEPADASAPDLNFSNYAINYARQARTPSGNAPVDLAGQEAVIDRKLEQTGQNAVTQSKAWDVLGNILGFQTKTDWEDAKAGVDAQQDMIARQQKQAQEDAIVKKIAEDTARAKGVDQLRTGFNNSLKTLVPTSKEDEAHINGLNIAGNEALTAMNSQDPEIRAAGAKQFEEVEAAKRKFALDNETQRIQQENWRETEDRARREGNAQLAETARHNRATEQLTREQNTQTREIGTQTQFYEQHGKVHDVVQGAINDVYASIEEAARTNNPAALVNAQKKIAKLTDPTTGVLQGEMRDMVASGLGDRLVRAYNRGRGAVNQEDLNDLLTATKAIEESERKMYERNLEIARNRARINGVDPSTLDGHAYKPLQSYGTASEAVKNKPNEFKPGDVISGGAEVILEGAKTVGGVVGSVFGN